MWAKRWSQPFSAPPSMQFTGSRFRPAARDGSDMNTVMKLAELSRAQTVPETYRFAPPVSPHLAARRAGVRIILRKIQMPATRARR